MSRSGPEALLDFWEWSRGTPGCSEVIGRPYRMCGMPIGIFGRSHGCPGVVESPSRMSGSGRKPSRIPGRPSLMSGSVRKSLPDVRVALSDIWVWSGVPPGCPGVVGRPSRMSESGQQSLQEVWEALPIVREWSGDTPGYLGVVGVPPGCPGVVGAPPGCPGVVGRPSRMCRSSPKDLQDV